MNLSDRPRALGAHIYAGGFTVGVSRHFDVLAHLEHAAYGASVVKLNFPGLPIYDGGPAAWPKAFKPRPNFIYANPPCAIWSGASAGRATAWHEDPRLKMHLDIFTLLEQHRPEVMAIESVTAMFTKGREHVDNLIESAAAQGYSTTVVDHDARWLGVAQIRKRVFLVFHRIAIPWQLPEFGDPMTVGDLLRRVKLRKPIYKLELTENSWGGGAKSDTRRNWVALARQAEPGERLSKVFDRLYPDPVIGNRGQKLGRPGFIYARAPLDRPCGVIMQGSLLHPTEDRVLHQDELAAICSFPRSFHWPPGLDYADVSGYMSRGVMPLVGEWLGRQVARALESPKRLNRQTAEVLDITRPPGRQYALVSDQTEETEIMAKKTIPAGPPPPEQGEGSGAYMRRLMTMGVNDDQMLLGAVRQHYPGSKAKESDVKWNRAKLAKESGAPPVAVAQTGRTRGPTTANAPRQEEIPFPVAPKKSTTRTPVTAAEIITRIAGGGKVELEAINLLSAAFDDGGTQVLITIKGGSRTHAVDGNWLRGLLR